MKTLTLIVGRLVTCALGFLSSNLSAAGNSTPRQTVAQSNVNNAAAHTPLHLAALRGDTDAVETLLRHGADANALNLAGATPLHYAVSSERSIATLLASGAQPNTISKAGVTPIFGAASRRDSFSVVRRLIEGGANVNIKSGLPTEAIGGGTLLSVAIIGGDRRTIALLLEPATKLDPKQHGPALVAAALVGDLETARALIGRGADPDTISGQAGTALNTALRGGHHEVAKLLVEHGAALDVKSLRGYRTPPVVFSAYNDGCDISMAQLLVERGVDINSANDIGDTALSYALRSGPDTELVRFLRERGAKHSAAPERAKTVPARSVPTDSVAHSAFVRESAQRAIDLMQRSSTAFLESSFVRNQGKCISCHQQSLPAMAYGLARERGLRVNEIEVARQLVAKVTQRRAQVGRALELITPTGGPVLALGHDAEELSAFHSAPDEITDAMSHYLLGVQATDGSWSSPIRRVPMGDGRVVATAWGIRAMQLYPPTNRAQDAADSVRCAREWLVRQDPASLNERIFQLLGLAWANESRARLQLFIEAVANEQRGDGGWGQLPGLASDAWATGTALHALHKAGVSTTHATYKRGVDYLLRTQFDDGSWWVRTRSWPFQPHFDSAFPHGRDQWISAAGTAWATTALLLTLEPTVSPASLTDARQMMAAFLESQAGRKQTADDPTGTSATSLPVDSARDHSTLALDTRPVTSAAPLRVDFARDIQPMLQRSCAECHGGAKPKGGFTVATREALVKGGQNGEPAIVPGQAEKSHLLRYVSDQVEDLEMPPLNRREKYPSLSAEEIKRLRAWIDAGAPWPETKKQTE